MDLLERGNLETYNFKKKETHGKMKTDWKVAP